MPVHPLKLAIAVTAALMAPQPVSAEIITDLRPVLFDTETPDRLYIDGPIDIRTSALFNQALARYPDAKTLVLSSQGGVVHFGLSLAYAVRAAGLSTHIPADAVCGSACSYVFLAGVGRTAEGGLGVHRLAHATDSLEAGQIALADVMAAFAEFEVPIEIVNRMLATPADEMYVFQPAELAEIGVLRTSASTRERELLSTEFLITCENAAGDRMATVEFSAREYEGRALNCVSGPFVYDMTPCAPVGGHSLSAPTGAGVIVGIVDRWQDYMGHFGGVVSHDLSAIEVSFSGSWMRLAGGLETWWTLKIDRIDGSATLDQKGVVEELSCYAIDN